MRAAEMKSVDQHLADCRTLLPPGVPIRVRTLDCVGYSLSEDVIAPADSPAFATSAMDGYAVRVVDVPGVLDVVGDVPAGVVPTARVAAGTAVRIMTGSALPQGTEAVVPVEDTDPDGGKVIVHRSTSPAMNLRSPGEDVRAGDIVLRRRQVIGPGQLAALLANAVEQVPVWRRPRVAILSTGDELVEAGSPVGPAQIVDTNGPALAAAAMAAGAAVVHQERVRDDTVALLAALDDLPPCDLILSSGGASMGAYDVVKAALAPLGLRFEPVAMQPGKPQGWGRFRGGPAFLGLPGNPVSALVCFELFGRAVLHRERPVLSAELTNSIRRRSAGKRQFLRGHLAGSTVVADPGHGSHLIAGYGQADCLVIVPESAVEIASGSLVQVIPLG